MINVGIIGLGTVAQLMHLPLLSSLYNEYKITAVCDVSPSLTDYIAGLYSAKAYASPEELTSDPDVDAVFVLSPDQYHADYGIMAMNAGKHVFIEKPVALCPQDLERLMAAEKANPGVICMVGYMRRYANGFLKCKELLQNDPAVKALLEGLWEETSGKTRDSFQINGIIYNAGGAVYTLDGTGVFFYRPDRALTDTQIANFNSNNAVYGTRVFEPTAKFNCHSYAWYKTQTWNNYWILYAEPFAGDTYCQEIYNTSSVQEKDVIVYWKYDSGQSDSVHSGVVESKVGNQITIKSKFGQAGIYLHTPSSVPYEYDYVTYYRYHHYTNQYTGNNYHSGSRHYFQYADTCTICGHRKNYTWISQYCGGPPCVTPSKSIGPFDE